MGTFLLRIANNCLITEQGAPFGGILFFIMSFLFTYNPMNMASHSYNTYRYVHDKQRKGNNMHKIYFVFEHDIKWLLKE